MKWLLRLYPRTWRERYGQEMAEMVEAGPRRLGLFTDLLAGAVDARMNPQWAPTTTKEEGQHMLSKLCGCGSTAYVSPKRTAMWVLYTSLAAVLLAFGLQVWVGESVYTESIRSAAFPIAIWVGEFHASAARRPPTALKWMIFVTAVVAM
jgi:hypothetical protein